MSTYYHALSDAELKQTICELEQEVADIRAQGLALNMARGKPCSAQLDLSMDMLDVLSSDDDLNDGGIDCRNYGGFEGIPSCRQLFGEVLGVPASWVSMGAESSLSLMFDCISHAMLQGVCAQAPMLLQMQEAPLKWLCFTPGYDRHFAITEHFGFELVSLALGDDGPDMDAVEELVRDPHLKGMWCVPKYSNPSGIIYSDEVVARIAALKPAAADFRVYWDNAYAEHDLYPDEPGRLANIFEYAEEKGNADLIYAFASTSKITFAGSGVSALAASPANLDDLFSEFKHRYISRDKVNQLRHVRYLGSLEGLRAHMARQADLLRPRFELVERRLSEGLAESDVATWTHPRGGYFVCFDGPVGSAKAIVDLCKSCGVVLTGAGAPYPYGKDPLDRTIRIAPSFPSLEELDRALQIFVTCVKLVSARLEAQARLEA